MKKLPVKIGGIVYRVNNEGVREFLLLKRTPQDGGFRQCITGTLHEGESFVDGIKREISEEAGIEESRIKKFGDLFHTFTWNKSNGQLIHEFVYSIEIDGNGFSPILSVEEHDEFMRADFDLAMKTLFTDNNKKSLELLNNILQS